MSHHDLFWTILHSLVQWITPLAVFMVLTYYDEKWR